MRGEPVTAGTGTGGVCPGEGVCLRLIEDGTGQSGTVAEQEQDRRRACGNGEIRGKNRGVKWEEWNKRIYEVGKENV